ncbi:MAG: lytic transglycosylase domain-containing protein [Alphaproteobacteria bacterium]
MRHALVLGCLLMLAACGTTGGPGAPSTGGGGILGDIFSSAPKAKASWDSKPEGDSWTQITRAALDADGVALITSTPTDMDAFCPNYAKLDDAGKKEFWVAAVSEIALVESALDPAKAGAQNRRGLLQITPEAAQRYGCANVGVAQLSDPQTNLGCGVKILAATSAHDQIVTGFTTDGWKGAARYWLSLRKPESIADLQEHLNAQNFCKRQTS